MHRCRPMNLFAEVFFETWAEFKHAHAEVQATARLQELRSQILHPQGAGRVMLSVSFSASSTELPSELL